jgi:MarR family transcriptional regulator, organic hydroperoxide resistance regulator
LAVARAKKKARKASPAGAQSRARTVIATVGRLESGKEPLGLFDDFLPHLVTRLAYLLNHDLVDKLRREGINVARWRILAVLAMGDGITIGEIIDRAMMQQSALSRVLMTMEEEEYVRRVPRREDARCVEVFLTERGRALFHSLDPVVRRRQGRLLKDFKQQEVDAAFVLLRRLIHNVSE